MTGTQTKLEASGSSKSSSSKMFSDEITLNLLTKFIKPYNGDKESLPAFLTNCDNAMALATIEQKNILYKYILSQLEGKAQVACSLKTFSSWDEIKVFLKSTFGEKKHTTHMLLDLQNCKQIPGEDVTKYSLRLEAILTRLQSEIHYSCKDAKELPGRIAAMEELALNTFLLGLSASISTIVRCRNPQTLHEAVEHAIEEEKLFNLKSSSPPSSSSGQRFPRQCSICHKSGHSASDCYKNRKPYANNQQTFHVNPSNPTQNNYFSNQCKYCKNFGHTIEECRKLKFKNSQNSQLQRPSASNPKPNVNFVVVDNDQQTLNTE